MAETDGKPGRDCPRCPRLVASRKIWRAKESAWFNSPVPSFGSINGRLLIVGLAPGLQGANRTGRPFTGDYAGVLLYETLGKYGFARGEYHAHFLRPTIGEMKKLRAIVALGRIAHESTVRALGGRLATLPFVHGRRHELGPIALFCSYHCSRYNTNTGVLTPEMFRGVFATVRRYLDS